MANRTSRNSSKPWRYARLLLSASLIASFHTPRIIAVPFLQTALRTAEVDLRASHEAERHLNNQLKAEQENSLAFRRVTRSSNLGDADDDVDDDDDDGVCRRWSVWR